MRIVFANDGLRNECNNQELLIKRYGANCTRLLRQRLDELFNAEVLADMRSMPHVNIAGSQPHPADLALDVGAPYRLVFRPYPETAAGVGGRDWKKIDCILVTGILGNDVEPNAKPV